MSWKTALAKLINNAFARYDIRLVRGADIWHPASQLGRQPEPPESFTNWSQAEPFQKTYLGKGVGSLQAPFDFSVVMPSILRPTINEPIESVFTQNFPGRVQLRIGIDSPVGDLRVVEEACR